MHLAKNTFCFQKIGPFISSLCFLPLAGRSKKNPRISGVPFLGREVSVWCAMECQMRVNDVFCAVSLSGTVRCARSVLLEKNRIKTCHK